MYVFNARLGHACNSSSSHSIIIIPKGKKMKGVSEQNGAGSFGWDNFVLLDAASKLSYIGHILREAGEQFSLTDQEVSDLLEASDVPDDAEYIDHQSMFSLPATHNSAGVHMGFTRELIKFIKRDDVAILGGNDNEDDDREGSWEDDHLVFSHMGYSDNDGSLVARRDTDGVSQWWVLFNKRTGNKVRMSFDNPMLSAPVLKPRLSHAPELVDIKITDYCIFDCPQCYMGSTKSGEHGDTYTITNTLDNLAEQGVFEIALGGGEPTLHPDFLDIIKHGYNKGLNMNFTTLNFAFFQLKKYAEFRAQVARYCNAIAFSVNSQKDLDRFDRMFKSDPFGDLDYGDRALVQMTMQCIPAMLSTRFLTQLFLYCQENHIRLTLLGFKRTGRGEEFEKSSTAFAGNQRWTGLVDSMIKDGSLAEWFVRGSLAVDTVLAQDCLEQFEEMGIEPTWYHTEEGAFSMFLDMVKLQLGPSSFAAESEMTEFRKWDVSTYSGENKLADMYRSMQTQQFA